jgi:hypothetical protein
MRTSLRYPTVQIISLMLTYIAVARIMLFPKGGRSLIESKFLSSTLSLLRLGLGTSTALLRTKF